MSANDKIVDTLSIRCSRPLCSSQSTGGTPPSPTRQPAQTRPTRKQTPESAWSLRTQQRAGAPLTEPPVPTRPEGQTY